MNDVAKLGDSIVRYLSALRRPVVERLNGPLDSHAIASFEQSFPFAFPYCLKALYSWRDGTEVKKGVVLDDLHFFPGFYFLSMEDALAHYRNFIGDPRWETNWFPVFANGGGDFYCVRCEPNDLDNCSILGFMLGQTEADLEFLSIRSLFETINEAYEKGAYFVDERGFLEADSEAEIKIAREKNPTVEYWET